MRREAFLPKNLRQIGAENGELMRRSLLQTLAEKIGYRIIPYVGKVFVEYWGWSSFWDRWKRGGAYYVQLGRIRICFTPHTWKPPEE